MAIPDNDPKPVKCRKPMRALKGLNWRITVTEQPDGTHTIGDARLAALLLWEIRQTLQAIRRELAVIRQQGARRP